MPPSFAVDGKEVVVRIIKYLLEGSAVAISCYLIPKTAPTVEEILTIALLAASVFAILDLFAPSIGHSTRLGAGLGLGSNLVGGFGGRLPA